MKQITTFIFAALLMAACGNSSQNQAENQAEEAPLQTFYGEEFDVSNPLTVAELEKLLLESDTLNAQVEGIIENTCSNMGCWMTFKQGEDQGETVRVVTEHEFFVPRSGCEGLRTVANGKVYRKEISVERLKHYAEESGKTAEEIEQITEPEYEIVFVASGAMIEGYTGDDVATAEEDHGHIDEDGHDHHDHDHEDDHGHEH